MWNISFQQGVAFLDGGSHTALILSQENRNDDAGDTHTKGHGIRICSWRSPFPVRCTAIPHFRGCMGRGDGRVPRTAARVRGYWEEANTHIHTNTQDSIHVPHAHRASHTHTHTHTGSEQGVVITLSIRDTTQGEYSVCLSVTPLGYANPCRQKGGTHTKPDTRSSLPTASGSPQHRCRWPWCPTAPSQRLAVDTVFCRGAPSLLWPRRSDTGKRETRKHADQESRQQNHRKHACLPHSLKQGGEGEGSDFFPHDRQQGRGWLSENVTPLRLSTTALLHSLW